MRTPFKILLGVLATVAALFVVLIIAVALILEPNDYRPYVVDAVAQATGRSFELTGDLELELFPCCAVSLGPAHFASPAGFPDPEFASLAQASLSVRLWPLLTRGEVQVGTVTLQELEVNLVQLADGTLNWELAADEDAPADPAAEAGGAPISLKVERVVLENGRIRYRDEQARQSFVVDNVTLDTRLAMTGDRVAVESPRLALRVAGTGIPERVDVSVSADAVTAVLAEAAAVAVDGLEVDVRTLGAHLLVTGAGRAGATPDLAGEFTLAETSPRELLAALSEAPYRPASPTALTRLAAQGRWRVSDDAAAVEALRVELDGATLTGSAALTDFDTLANRFELTLDAIDLDRYLPADAAPDATAAEPAPAAATELPLALLAELPVDGKVRISVLTVAGTEIRDLAFALASRGGEVSTRLEARALGGSLKLEGGGNAAAAEPRLAGTLEATGIELRPLLSSLEVETADPDVLRSFAGSARWQLTPRSAALDELRWTLDDTTLSGAIRVSDFDRLATGFDLAVDRMNVDAYLPPDTDEPAQAEAGAELIPVDAVRDLVLDGRLRAGELVVAGLTLRDVSATVTAADGILRLDPLRAAMYGGTYNGQVTVDATGATPKLTLDQELAAVQVNDILASFFDSDVLAGSLSLKLAGSGSGNSAAELLRGLAADVSFDLADGVYRGANVLYQMQRARAMLKNEPPPEPPENPETPIRALHASGQMADGVLRTRDLSARTDALRLLGSGGINLVDMALDYRLDAEVLGDTAAVAKLGDLAGLRIPLTLEGPVSGPRVGVDLKGLLSTTVRDTIQNKARDALLERLGGDQPQAPGGAGSTEGGTAPAGAAADPASGAPEAAGREADKPSTRDLLKRGLRELLKEPQETPPEGEQQPQ